MTRNCSTSSGDRQSGYYFLPRFNRDPLVVFVSFNQNQNQDDDLFDCWVYFLDTHYISGVERDFLNSRPYSSKDAHFNAINGKQRAAKILASKISEKLIEILLRDPLMLRQQRKTIDLMIAIADFANRGENEQ
jgi:hypothetical protein